MRYYLFAILVFHYLKVFSQQADPIPPGVQRLLDAYPDHLEAYQDNYIYWKDGSLMQYDDSRFKTEEEAFDSTDLEDHMNALIYPPGLPVDTPGFNCDPGTLRCQEFFMKMYGSTEASARSHLVPVTWLAPKPGQTKRIWVTSINGVNEHLQAVAQELVTHPHLRPYVTDIGGTFNWRPIMGTQRMSPHSFGIAIDLNTRRSEYWKWDYKDNWQLDSVEINLAWRNSLPLEIVEIFERHGFIWGGKWFHYDTMHFEYRPEMLPSQKRRNVGKPTRKPAPGKKRG